MSTVSFSATTSNRNFLKQITTGKKSKYINVALDFYRKFLLQKEMEAGFLAENKENQKMAEWGIDDYKKIVFTMQK